MRYDGYAGKPDNGHKEGEDYPWEGRLDGNDYIGGGTFVQPGSLIWDGRAWVWNSEELPYNNLTCQDYPQCRKHARISCDYTVGLVYNYTYDHVVCECPYSSSNPPLNKPELNLGDECDESHTGYEIMFNESTCSWEMYCNRSLAYDNAPECRHDERRVFNYRCCAYRCVRGGTSGGGGRGGGGAPPGGASPGPGTGAGLRSSDMSSNIMLAPFVQSTKLETVNIDSEVEDKGPVYLASEHILLTGCPTCDGPDVMDDTHSEDSEDDEVTYPEFLNDIIQCLNYSETQGETSNCFEDNTYYQALLNYSRTHDRSELTYANNTREVNLNDEDVYNELLEEGYVIPSIYRPGESDEWGPFWDYEHCQAVTERRLGWIMDNTFLRLVARARRFNKIC